MQTIIIQICLSLFSVIATILSGYAVTLLKNQVKGRNANSRGTMLLLQTQLIEYHEKWVDRGYVTKHGLRNFLEMYDAYKNLGGNGLIDNLKKEIESLPIKGD